MPGLYDHVARQLVVHTSRSKRSRDFLAHLEQLDRLHIVASLRLPRVGRSRTRLYDTGRAGTTAALARGIGIDRLDS